MVWMLQGVGGTRTSCSGNVQGKVKQEEQSRGQTESGCNVCQWRGAGRGLQSSSVRQGYGCPVPDTASSNGPTAGHDWAQLPQMGA